FIKTKNLTSAKFAEGTKITTIPAEMLRYSGITEFTVPNSVTTIGNYAFMNNLSLKTIHIPNSVTSFGSYILRGSTSVEEITLPGHIRLVSLFYDTGTANMSKVISKVNVASGST